MTAHARIGPNAVLQHLPVLDAELGVAWRGALLHLADVREPPATAGMLDEASVARLHHAVRLFVPDRAAAIHRAAGLATGDYILANRIPRPAQMLIRALPALLGARVLSAAIARHSWTFAGSGRFSVCGHAPLCFEIAANPLAQRACDHPVCDWHCAVFERLFSALVWPDARVVEMCCCATGAPGCRFRIAPQGCK
ncbi:bacteriochlorophyll 4-vinyl reductase [Roseinatronobacter sp. NSM]|uniref:bacteriochlorophyll 4-vinyl reductase n=1 Tax=Roseinatronobacter sp. NSM TaxID=3457785 RepID=UPI0040370F8B